MKLLYEETRQRSSGPRHGHPGCSSFLPFQRTDSAAIVDSWVISGAPFPVLTAEARKSRRKKHVLKGCLLYYGHCYPNEWVSALALTFAALVDIVADVEYAAVAAAFVAFAVAASAVAASAVVASAADVA